MCLTLLCLWWASAPGSCGRSWRCRAAGSRPLRPPAPGLPPPPGWWSSPGGTETQQSRKQQLSDETSPSFFCLPCIESFPLLDLLRPLLLDGELFMWSCHARTSEGTSVCYIWWHGVFVPDRPKTVFHVFLWLRCHVDMFTKGTNKRNNI